MFVGAICCFEVKKYVCHGWSFTRPMLTTAPSVPRHSCVSIGTAQRRSVEAKQKDYQIVCSGIDRYQKRVRIYRHAAKTREYIGFSPRSGVQLKSLPKVLSTHASNYRQEANVWKPHADQSGPGARIVTPTRVTCALVRNTSTATCRSGTCRV